VCGDREPDDCEIDVWAESLVVVGLLGVSNGRTRERLYRSLREVDPSRIDLATARLVRAGVLDQVGGRLVQSPALERLERLDMISL
jgi:hypothetical protein